MVRGMVFPNANYLVLIDPEKKYSGEFKRKTSDLGCRALICESIVELGQLLGVVRRPLGVIAYASTEAAYSEVNDLCRILQEAQIDFRFVFYGTRDTFEFEEKKIRVLEMDLTKGIAAAIGDLIKQSLPKFLDELIVSAANDVFPSLLKGFHGFELAQSVSGVFDRQVNVYATSENLIGQCILRASTSSLKADFPGASIEKIEDSLRECGSQFFGVFARALQTKNIDSRIGLPTLFDLRLIPGVHCLQYFPSIHGMESSGRLAVSVGFLGFGGQPLPSFEGTFGVASGGGLEFF